MNQEWKRAGSAFALLGAVSILSSCQSISPCQLELERKLGGETEQSVDIHWDAHGVPHIFAEADRAGYFGFGWAQMETRANLVLNLYARARGDAASIIGEPGMRTDFLIKAFDVPARAQTWYGELDEAERIAIDAYVDGMNQWASENPEKISEDLKGLLPIQATDPLAHLYQVMHLTFISYETFVAPPEATTKPGSNALAIAPAKSDSGNAMLIINPHLPWGDLFTWTEMHLDMPSYEIYGAALTGLPFMGTGFSQFGGWTHTVNHYDGIDLFVIEDTGDGYRLDGKVHPYKVRDLTFEVKQPDGTFTTVTQELRETVHGPVLPGSGDEVIAARIYAWDSYGMLSQYYDMAGAENLAMFEAAQSRLQVPFFNTVYASSDGDIMYFYGGRVPKRKREDWHFWHGKVPGDSSEWIPEGYHTYEEMPLVKNPDSGFVQNANDPPWTSTWPPLLKPEAFPTYMAPNVPIGYRAQKSLDLALGDDSITFDELVNIKQSSRLGMADRHLDQLVAIGLDSEDELIRSAAKVLANWDRESNVDSTGAVLFMKWADFAFIEEDCGKPIFSTEDWQSNTLSFPQRIENHEAAQAILRDAAEEVLEMYGKLDVTYGEVYRLRMGAVDLPASGAADRFGVYKAAEPTQTGDATETIISGDTFVAVVEFGEEVRAVGNLVYANTEDQSDPSYSAGLETFSSGQLRNLSLDRDEIARSAVRSETIAPSPLGAASSD